MIFILFKKFFFPIRFFPVIFLAIISNACLQKDCFKKAGDVAVETRQISAFKSISIYDDVDIILQPSNTDEVIVEAGQNILHEITTLVEDSILTIKNATRCNWIRDNSKTLQVTIKFKKLDRIVHNGYGTISSSGLLVFSTLAITILGQGDVKMNINADNLECNLYFLGDIILEGTCKNLFVDTYNHGFFRGRNLSVENCEAINVGEGDFEISLGRSLNAKISGFGLGSIYYRGNPTTVNIDIQEGSKGVVQPIN